MPRPSLTDEQRRETRRSIRNAAAKLFAENGSKNLSVREIAKSAGVSVGTVYAHFKNLTELMQSLWKKPVSRLITELSDIFDSTEDPSTRIEILLHCYLDFSVAQQPVYRGAFMFVRPESHDKPTPVSLDQDRLYSLFYKTIIEGQEKGLFREGNPNLITQNIWSGLHGAIALPINVDRLALTPSKKNAGNMIDLLLEWLRS